MQEMNNGHSSAFHNQEFPDPLQLIDESEIREIEVPEQTIELPADPNSQRVTLSFYYKCVPTCEKLWIQPSVISYLEGLDLEVKLPLLERLNWFSIQDQMYVLYQKNPQYESVAELAALEPMSNVLAGEVYIYNNPRFSSVLMPLREAENIDKAEFIITTLREPAKIGEWTHWGIALPREVVSIDDAGMMKWKLIHETKEDTHPRIWIARISYQ